MVLDILSNKVWKFT